MGICGEGKNQPIHHGDKGGNRAALFIYVTMALENMAFIANDVSFFTYFYGYKNFNLTKSATTLTNFMGTAFLLVLFGGFISDTYLPRFKTSILFGSIEFLGYIILTAQAHFKQLRPFPCIDMPPTKLDQCENASSVQIGVLYIGLYLIVLGTGGVKAAIPSLGADQFDESDPEEAPQQSSFFNWLLFSITIGAAFGVTFIVWIGANLGWKWSFGVSTVAILLAFVFLRMGKSIFRNNIPRGALYFVFYRFLWLPSTTEELYEIDNNEVGIGHEIIQRSQQFK